MARFNRKLVCLQLILVLVLLSACAAQRPEPDQQAGKPRIPEAINRGENREPELTVYIAESGKKQKMEFEEYIMGVVAAEIDPNWPVEALAAQAILARTFTLQKIAEDGGVPERGAHASTNIEEFQAYDADRINEKVRQAVERTRGVVLAHNGRFIRAWFHAYSGGKTASAKDGLGFTDEPTPYIKVVDDPGTKLAPPEDKFWQVRLSADEIRQKLKEKTGKDPGEISSIEVAAKNDYGRATQLRVGNITVSAPAFRLALGSTKVKSTWFKQIKVENGTVTISGTGYGHGVGMSQWGARALAEQGKEPEDIVKYWFNNVQTYKLWN